MRFIDKLRWCVMVCAAVLAIGGVARAQCAGDCSADSQVAINEIIGCVNIALGAPVSNCAPCDVDGDGSVAINELIQAVNSALNGCPSDCDDCDDGNACTMDVCENGQCVYPAVACQDDGNECTAESCDSVSGCGSSAVEDGTSCAGGNGECAGGACMTFECVDDDSCDDGNTCTANTCISNMCMSTNVVCEDDGNECTVEACDPGSGCGSSNKDDGTSCDGGAGSCRGGVCLPPVQLEYQQNFESLDPMDSKALADDGWKVFGNVFDGVTYKYGYGAFPAPNGGPAFCAVDSAQGGAEQGDQQLSIYNDYNNMDHAKGYLIESNVFRERRIKADEVGKTLVFSFDAKRGNINDPADPLCPCTSTAFAFIKTLNPAAGFATTNLVKQETTAIPQMWDRYTLSLPIDAGLVNQLLQVGFTSTATRYQPSGVFYDNLEVGNVPTVP